MQLVLFEMKDKGIKATPVWDQFSPTQQEIVTQILAELMMRVINDEGSVHYFSHFARRWSSAFDFSLESKQ